MAADYIFGPHEVPQDFHFGGGCYLRIFGFCPNTVGTLALADTANAKVLFSFNHVKSPDPPTPPTTGSGGREWTFGAIIDVKSFGGIKTPSATINLNSSIDPRNLQVGCVSFGADARLGDPTSVNFKDSAGRGAGGFFAHAVQDHPNVTISASGQLLGEDHPGAGGIVPPEGNKSGLWYSAGVNGTYPDTPTGSGVIVDAPCGITLQERSSGINFAFDILVYNKKPDKQSDQKLDQLAGITKLEAIEFGKQDAAGMDDRFAFNPFAVVVDIAAQFPIRNVGDAVPITSGAVQIFLARIPRVQPNKSIACWLGGDALDLYRMVQFDPGTSSELFDSGNLPFGIPPPVFPKGN